MRVRVLERERERESESESESESGRRESRTNACICLCVCVLMNVRIGVQVCKQADGQAGSQAGCHRMVSFNDRYVCSTAKHQVRRLIIIHAIMKHVSMSYRRVQE